MFNKKTNIFEYDEELCYQIKKEQRRQEKHIELIASENYVSNFVLKIQGSVLTNKYAEGYPNRRYYGGCKYVDNIENLAIHRAKKLFDADYANVQPHSGSQANFAVYTAILKPGDTILGMKLSHGGHLTHGSPVNLSGKLYNVVSYGLDKNGFIDYQEMRDLAHYNKPKLIIGGFSAYSGICNWKKMREIADEINAFLLADISHVAGLIATNLYPSPIEHAHIVTTTTHKTLAGPRGGMILARGGDLKLYKKIDASVFPGSQGGPLMHIIAAKALSLKEASEPQFKIYQRQVIKNAKTMVKFLINRGYKIISGQTSNHLFLLDLINKNITGQKACIALEKFNITVNKNSVPNDIHGPYITSGIRIGTPAITRRGLKEKEVKILSNWIADILDNINDLKQIEFIKQEISHLCMKFPVYN